jgi:hypothetical protein
MTTPASLREDASVLYVGGCQRSGSTMLDRLLGQMPDFVSAGEIVHLWTRGLLRNEPCGCGVDFRSCPFWAEVGHRAFGGWDRVDAEEIVRLQGRVDRTRYIPLMLVPALSLRYRRSLTRYQALLRRLYGAIADVGHGTVVDSSKHASTAFLLRTSGLQVDFVHLVRDSRGVAYSLMKKVRRPEVAGRADLMYSSGPWRSGIEWLLFNSLFAILGWLGKPLRFTKYEDLSRTPATVVEGLSGQTSATPAHAEFLEDHRATLGVDHTVAGNPIRFYQGVLEIRQDDDWHELMRPADRRITTFLTWPLLLAYRYRLAAG